MASDDPATFTVEGAEVAGHRVKLVTEAATGSQAAEKEAEKIHMDLKARMQRLDDAVSSQNIHPDDATPLVKVDWDRVFGLDGGEEDD